MKRILLLTIAALSLGSEASHAEESNDAPSEVLQVLEQLVGSWYAELGGASYACTVNGRVNGRCVVLEGRRFSDAISCTSLIGWYAPSRQVIGLVVFENGESLLVRANVRGESDQLTLKGNAVGILGGKPVRATYEATCGAKAWSIDVTTNSGETVKGHLQSTG